MAEDLGLDEVFGNLSLKDSQSEEESAVKIQKVWRGYFQRKGNRELKDSMTLDILKEYIDSYHKFRQCQEALNKLLKRKKIRTINFPSEISENIVKFALRKKRGFTPNWDSEKGDLVLNGKQLEVKGSSDLFGGGPSSFGPKEAWHRIYFLDGKETYQKNYKIWEVKLSNKSEMWKKIKISKKETYEDQCLQGRRPRTTFSEILKQLPPENVEMIFDGNLSSLS